MKPLPIILLLLLCYFQVSAYQGLDSTFGTKGKIAWKPLQQIQGSKIKLLPDLHQAQHPFTFFGICEVNGIQNLFVQHVTEDLSPDTAFTKDGIQYYPITFPNTLQFAIRDSGSNLIFVGTDNVQGKKVIAVYKYTAAFKPDSSFGNAGVVNKNMGIQDDEPTDIFIQADGKIGISFIDRIASDPKMLRLTAQGNLDSSFGNQGIFQFQSLQSMDAMKLALLPSGKIVMGLSHLLNSTYKTAMLCLQPNGQLDSSFGNSGLNYLNLGTGHESILEMWPNKWGGIAVLANAKLNGQNNRILFQLQANGSINQGFGTFGICILGQNLVGIESFFTDSNSIRLQTGRTLFQISDSGTHVASKLLPREGTLFPLVNKWVQWGTTDYTSYSTLNRSVFKQNFDLDSLANPGPEIKPGSTLIFEPNGLFAQDSRNEKMLLAFGGKDFDKGYIRLMLLDSTATSNEEFESAKLPIFPIRSSTNYTSIAVAWQTDSSFLFAMRDSQQISVFSLSTNGKILSQFFIEGASGYGIPLKLVTYPNQDKFLLAFNGIKRYSGNGQEDSSFSFDYSVAVHALKINRNETILAGLDTSLCLLQPDGKLASDFGKNGHVSTSILARFGWQNLKCTQIQQYADGGAYLLIFSADYQASSVSKMRVTRVLRMDMFGKTTQVVFENNAPVELGYEYHLQACSGKNFLLAEKSSSTNSTNRLLLFNHTKQDTTFAKETWVKAEIPCNFHQLSYFNKGRIVRVFLLGNEFQFSRYLVTETQGPLVFPTAIIASKTTPGFGDTISLKPNTTNLNTSYTWDIEPKQFRFIKGTTKNDALCWIELLKPGSYTVKLTSKQDEDSSQIQQTNYLTLVHQLEFSSNKNDPGVNVVFQLNSQVSGNVKAYQWMLNPPTHRYMNGTDSSSKNPYLVLTEPGWYTLSLKVNYPDTAITLTKKNFLYAIPSGLNSWNNKSEIEYWPNPTNKEIWMHLKSGQKINSIQVRDIEGREYPTTYSWENESIRISLPERHGAYLLSIKTSSDELHNIKVLKLPN